MIVAFPGHTNILVGAPSESSEITPVYGRPSASASAQSDQSMR